jgi:hypothetical protein
MDKQKVYAFSNLFVKRLGEFVSELHKLANANGLRDEEFKKVAKTTFEILGRKEAISVASLNQTIARRK